MIIEQAAPTTISVFWEDVGSTIGQCDTLSEAAQELAARLYKQFKESVVLARVFLTIPFAELPSWDQNFVRGVAESAGSGSDLKPDTVVLSLIGTCGEEAEWRDRRQSKGHAGIPLLSSKFVGGIPMISRLLNELGLTLDWLDKSDNEIVIEAIGKSVGLFFVDNASEATDDEGRKIIAAQDFVSTHNVQSVFGTGTAYADGKLITIIVFCRDLLPRTAAENFLDLAALFKSKTSGLVESSRIFAGND